jgi:heptosyltransferase-2|tara:strand:- start:42 stop:1067 length:1026 start_codon:yes stop_codon:yes gene_type:complete
LRNNNIKSDICVIAPGKGMGNFFSNIAYFKQIYKEEGSRITFLTRKLTSAADVFKGQSFSKKVYYIDEYKRGLKGIFQNFLSFLNIVKLINKINPEKIFILHSSSRYTLASFFSKVPSKNIYAPGYKFQNFLINNKNKIFKSYFSKPLEPKLENKLLVEKIYNKKITEDNSIKLKDDQKKYVCIAIAQSGTSRQWGKDNYIKIIEYLITREFKFFLILSGPSQKDIEDKISAYFIDKIEITKTSELKMNDCLNLLNQSIFYVGNDTGFPHLSISLKIPSVVIHGDCVPHFHLYDEQNLIYSVDTDYPKIRKLGSDTAIKSISVDKVRTAVDKLLVDHDLLP